MNEGLKILQLSVFEIISYFFPGVVFSTLFITLIPSINFSIVTENIVAYIFISYILGNLIHSLSGIPHKFLWIIYHRFKEKDSKGHGVNAPHSCTGRIIHKMRYSILDRGVKENLTGIANSKIQKLLKKEKLINMDLSQIKEMALITNANASSYFEYLNYQKTLSKSLSFIFFLYSISTIIISLFIDYSIYLPNNVVNTPYLALVTFSISISLSVLFNNRFLFFKQYREAILNSNIILNFDNAENV